MAKHAYLIMAHNQFYILEKLLRLIDDKRNDIFLHIDKKVSNFDFDYFRSIIKNSNIFFIKRYDIKWADISQTEATIALLEESKKKGVYKYYHLLSGADLPLKNQDEIHAFFDNNNKEYIHFCTNEHRIDSMYKYDFYWLFTKELRGGIKHKFFKMINLIIVALQFFFINRSKKDNINIRVGANWFSITDDLVSYLLNNKKWILTRYKNTISSDESFLQTIAYNSIKFRSHLSRQGVEDDNYLACLRYIDWKRGIPYVWTINDFNELINSNYLFARKFDINKDKSIINKIYDTLKS